MSRIKASAGAYGDVTWSILSRSPNNIVATVTHNKKTITDTFLSSDLAERWILQTIKSVVGNQFLIHDDD